MIQPPQLIPGSTIGLLCPAGAIPMEKVTIATAILESWGFQVRIGKTVGTKFGHFSAEKQDKLKRKALKDYALSEKRITDICKDIVQHYKGKIFANGHKAMIVCGGRTAAVNYQKALHKLREQGFHDFESKVVVSLGSPKNDKIARECYETLAYNKENPATPKPLWVVPTEQIKAVIDNFKFPFEFKSFLTLNIIKKHIIVLKVI